MAKRRTKKKPGEQAKAFELEHQRSADFRTVYADGALLKVLADGTVAVTFYIDDAVVYSETGEEVARRKDSVTYNLTKVHEKTLRIQQVSVRLRQETALRVVKLILDRIGPLQPDTLERFGIRRLAQQKTRGSSK